MLLAFQATRVSSFGMATEPVEHDTTEAVLHACPGLLVALRDRTSELLDALPLCAWLAPAKGVELPHAMRNKHRETDLTVQGV